MGAGVDHSRAGAQKGLFATTHWSVVLAAGRQDAPQASEALEKLCQTYWYPIYAHVRRQGKNVEDAEDLVQGFFAGLLAKDFPQGVTPERGRFRSFLLASLHNFMVDQLRHAAASKRGGLRPAISLDRTEAEQEFCREPHHELTPDKLYERAWARTLLARARSQLREDYYAAGNAHLYFALKDFPAAGKSERSFQEAAAELKMSVPAVKAAVHRLRTRYRQLVREEIAQTVSDRAELNEEVRHLIAVIAS